MIRIVVVAAAVIAAVAILDSDRGIPLAVLILIGFVAGMQYVATRTRFGRHVFAVGGWRTGTRGSASRPPRRPTCRSRAPAAGRRWAARRGARHRPHDLLRAVYALRPHPAVRAPGGAPIDYLLRRQGGALDPGRLRGTRAEGPPGERQTALDRARSGAGRGPAPRRAAPRQLRRAPVTRGAGRRAAPTWASPSRARAVPTRWPASARAPGSLPGAHRPRSRSASAMPPARAGPGSRRSTSAPRARARRPGSPRAAR